MWRVREILLRLLNTLRRGEAERQLSREIEAHLAILEEDFRRRGLTPESARAAARREFGGVEQVKEVQRDARGFRWLQDAGRDIGYAVRTLRRTPVFTAVAVITLGLGIGAVTVIYSVVRNVVLDPFPYAHSDRLVDVVIRDGSGRLFRGPLPADEWLDYREHSDVFEDAAGAIDTSMHYLGQGGAQRVSVVRVTPNTFAFLGVAPLAGRPLGDADALPGAPPVAVLSHRGWMTMFGGDPSMLGRSVTLDGQPRTIVGIMPPRFEWHAPEFWIPSPISRAASGADAEPKWFQARLRRGVSIEAAEAQLNVIARRRAAAFPADYPERSRVQVITVIDWVVGRFRQTLYTLFAAVGLLLVIACCNVANMLLARATARERELTLRAALGAGRGRIVRQLLMESLVLAALGTVVGVTLASAGVLALAGVLPRSGVAWEVELRLDRAALLFALATAAASTLTFGLLPAVMTTRRDLVRAINSGGRLGAGGRGHARMRRGLIVAEVALSVVLLLGAGLLMRTFVSLVGVDLGIDTRNLLTAELSFPADRRSAAVAAAAPSFYMSVLERVRAMPGVQSAALVSSNPPFNGVSGPLEIPGISVLEETRAATYLCSEDYDRTFGLRLRAGRGLTAGDVAAGRHVAVVNDTLAARFFGGQSAIGRTLRLPRIAALPGGAMDPSFEIVGIVQDVKNQGVTVAPLPHVYVPFTVRAMPRLLLAVRAAAEPMALVEPIRREVTRLDATVAFGEPETLDDELMRTVFARPRFNALVLGIFAGTGLLLITLGIYGVVAYTVSQQTRQIAIRMALGGERRHVLRMVLGAGLTPVALGLAIGAAAGALTNRLLESVLFRVTPYDPVTIAFTIVLVVAIGVCACCVPAWRAMRVEPVVALRQE